MVHLILGYGEVGQSLHAILGTNVVWKTRTGGSWRNEIPDVIHVCFPYWNDFIKTVTEYKNQFPGALIIVHSSVPVGTCDALNVVHSPIRGVHPNLTQGIRTFVKYFGGENATEAAKMFEDLGLKTKVYPEAKTTEALKLWDTTQYGILIMLEKGIHRWCEENKVDFDEVYTYANKEYNRGYVALGRPEVVRPYLKHIPGPIGGHCVIPNAKLLGKEFEFPEIDD